MHLRHQPARHRVALVPGVERRRGAAAGDEGADEAHGDVGARRPGVDHRVVDHGGAGDLALRQAHVLRHRPAHAAQRLGGAGLGEHARGTLHVLARDHAVGARGRHHLELDLELAGERAHRRSRADRRAAVGGGRERGRRFGAHLLADLHLADHGAGVGSLGAALEAGERGAHMHQLAGLAVQFRDAAVVGGGDVHDRLGGLDRDQRLVGGDLVARLDVPFDDLGFLQSFAQVGQLEDLHDASRVLRAAATMRSTLGRYWYSSRDSGITVS